MIVVADTEPLNYLIRLGHEDLLRILYRRVIIPGAVLRELQHPNAPRAVMDWAAHLPGWIEVAESKTLDTSLRPSLGRGEREAISLALRISAGLLLIGDRAGRSAAMARGLTVTGTLCSHRRRRS